MNILTTLRIFIMNLSIFGLCYLTISTVNNFAYIPFSYQEMLYDLFIIGLMQMSTFIYLTFYF